MLYIAEMQQGISDEEVLKQANSNQAVLITTDKDFGELVFRMGRINSGVILIRLEGFTPENKAVLVSSAVQNHDEKLDNSLPALQRSGFSEPMSLVAKAAAR